MQEFRYSDASQAYKDLLHNFQSQIGANELQSTKDDAGAVQLMRPDRPEAVTFNGPVDIPLHREPDLDNLDANVATENSTDAWILDTGANFSTVSVSFAHRLGIQVSP